MGSKSKFEHVNVNIDAKLFLMGKAQNLGKTPTGILALLVPMRSELSIKQKLSLEKRQAEMRALLEKEMQEIKSELDSLHKSVHWKHDCSNPVCWP